ncbi:MAG: hypothetical protein HKN67_00250 [Saprospiraceae bacterium]|nr:hypothetical protein [Bacteroidia bacterium]MBT8230799.1 hypothetical protein [Bacteroidia bacterium]NNF20346.1 hypothetical protein [Saprospiraceae bacterium]NNK89482.1 hypothetical protein [Saprospiraceae bacterium]
MKAVYTILSLIILLLLIQTTGFGQNDTASPEVDQSNKVEIANEDPYGIFDSFKGNPGKAGLYSLILPGAGQIYNKRWWKAPLFVAAEGIAIGILVYNTREYRDWDQGYKDMANGITDNYLGLTNISTVRGYRDKKRQNMDYSWLGVIGVHIFAAADAFVDKHLTEFNVNDDISFRLSPIAPYPGMNVTVSF